MKPFWCLAVCFGCVLIFFNCRKIYPLKRFYENLRCSKEGLTSEAAEERLKIFSDDKLEEKKLMLHLLVALRLTQLVFQVTLHTIDFARCS